MASSGVRTSSVTVFTIPPLYVSLKVSDEPLRRVKYVRCFFALEMAMITLTAFVVIKDYTCIFNNISQAILEAMG